MSGPPITRVGTGEVLDEAALERLRLGIGRVESAGFSGSGSGVPQGGGQQQGTRGGSEFTAPRGGGQQRGNRGGGSSRGPRWPMPPGDFQGPRYER